MTNEIGGRCLCGKVRVVLTNEVFHEGRRPKTFSGIFEASYRGDIMDHQLWIEPVGGVILARMRGLPTEALLKECQEHRMLNFQYGLFLKFRAYELLN